MDAVFETSRPQTNSLEETQRGRCTFHIERLIVLNEADGSLEIVVVRVGVDPLPTGAQAKLAGRSLRLRRVFPAAEVERERSDLIRIAAKLHACVSSQQQNRGAIDAAGKRNGNQLIVGHAGKPSLQRVGSCQDVCRTDFVEIRRSVSDRWIEESAIARRGIGAP